MGVERGGRQLRDVHRCRCEAPQPRELHDDWRVRPGGSRRHHLGDWLVPRAFIGEGDEGEEDAEARGEQRDWRWLDSTGSGVGCLLQQRQSFSYRMELILQVRMRGEFRNEMG